MTKTRKNGALVTEAGALKKALLFVGRAIEARTTIPILTCVYIEDDRLVGTDLDRELSTKIASTRADLHACVSHRQLLNVVSGLPADTVVTVSRSDDQIRLLFKGGAYELMSMDTADFQLMDPPEADPNSAGNWSLIEALQKVRPAISKEETRYYLNGVSFYELGDEGPHIIATDGHRLHGAAVPGLPTTGNPIIPRKIVEDVLAMGAVETMSIDENTVEFHACGCCVRGKLVHGVFPDVARVIPNGSDRNSILLPKQDMRGAIKRLAAISTERSRQTLMSAAGATLVLSAKGDDAKSGAEVVPRAIVPDKLNNAEIIGSFNARYLLDMFDMMAEDEVDFSVNDPASPAIVREGGNFSVIMPIRAGDGPRSSLVTLAREGVTS